MTHLIVRRFRGLNHTADKGVSCSTTTRNAQVTINYRIVLITLISLAIAPMAAAQIYKCDGPDGPVYSDRECGADATHVELSTTPEVSGGVYDEAKVELAEKKANREQARNSNIDNTDFSNLNSAGTTEPAGRWVRNPQQIKNRIDSRDPKPGTPPIAVKPRTQPIGVKRRR